MNDECAHFAGMDRFACRKALLKELEESGVLQGKTAIKHAVGHGDRSRRADRADGDQAVVREDGPAGRARAGPKPAKAASASIPATLDQGLQPAGWKNVARLVHLAPDLVGPPHPGLALRRLRRNHRGPRRRRRLRHCGSEPR